MKTESATNEKTKVAIELGREVLSQGRDANNILTTIPVHPWFQTHYFNPETDKHGIAALIVEILMEQEAIFPAGIENTELRSVAIAACPLTKDIVSEVQARFTAGSTRYPRKTILHNLGVVLLRKGLVGKITLKPTEKSGENTMSRVRWYLIQNPTQ